MQLDFLPPEKSESAPQKDAVMESGELHGDEEKAPSAFKTISEAASLLEVPQHVLRFWESRFSQIKPLKMRGGRRYYRPEDIEILSRIKTLLYKQGYTIKGAKKAFESENLRGEPVLSHSDEMPKAAFSTPREKPLSDKQKNQLAVVRQELISLRDALKPYLA